MLNYNKIDSSINYQRTPKTAIADYLGIAESTLRSRLERHNLTPDDIEKLADYFKRPMTYFFDREPEEDISKEPEIKYFSCPDCIKKQKELDDIRAERDALRLEVLELYRHKKG